MYLSIDVTYSLATNLHSVRLPAHACTEGTQISWTQADGFTNNTGVWQLDNVAVLYANELEASLLDTFTSDVSLSSILFYSGGTIQVKVVAFSCVH